MAGVIPPGVIAAGAQMQIQILLMKAAISGRVKDVEASLVAGAPVDCPDLMHSPLYNVIDTLCFEESEEGVHERLVQVAQVLVARGANASLVYEGKTPVQRAAEITSEVYRCRVQAALLREPTSIHPSRTKEQRRAQKNSRTRFCALL